MRVSCARLMPAVLETMAERKDLLSNEIYLLSAVTALQRVSETLPHFISPYLHATVSQVWSHASSRPPANAALWGEAAHDSALSKTIDAQRMIPWFMSESGVCRYRDGVKTSLLWQYFPAHCDFPY